MNSLVVFLSEHFVSPVLLVSGLWEFIFSPAIRFRFWQVLNSACELGFLFRTSSWLVVRKKTLRNGPIVGRGGGNWIFFNLFSQEKD